MLLYPTYTLLYVQPRQALLPTVLSPPSTSAVRLSCYKGFDLCLPSVITIRQQSFSSSRNQDISSEAFLLQRDDSLMAGIQWPHSGHPQCSCKPSPASNTEAQDNLESQFFFYLMLSYLWLQAVRQSLMIWNFPSPPKPRRTSNFPFSFKTEGQHHALTFQDFTVAAFTVTVLVS